MTKIRINPEVVRNVEFSGMTVQFGDFTIIDYHIEYKCKMILILSIECLDWIFHRINMF